MNNKITKFFTNNFYFCMFYLFVSLIQISILREIPYIHLLNKVAIAWGALLSLVNIYIIIKRKPNPIEISLFVFLALTFVLNLLVYRSSDNIKIWIVNLILFTSIFFINKDKTKGELKKELSLFSNIYICISLILSIASIILILSNTTITINGFAYGYEIGNLKGVFDYKNSLGLIGAISLLLCSYQFFKSSNIKIKVFYVLTILFDFYVVITAGGRSSYLLLLAIPFVYIFVILKNKIMRACMILIPAVICIGGFAVLNEKLFAFLSGRSELWISSSMVIKDNLLFGVGNSDLVERVYAARPGEFLPGIEAGGLHNIFLQITTANGIFALITFMLFLYFSFSLLVKKIDKTNFKDEKAQSLALLSLTAGLVFVNVFESNLIYIVSFIAIIFWTYLGYFLSIKIKD